MTAPRCRPCRPRGAPFIARIQREIPARFATSPQLPKRFFQYTGKINGAISYVNLKVWNSIDLDMPTSFGTTSTPSARRRLHRAHGAIAAVPQRCSAMRSIHRAGRAAARTCTGLHRADGTLKLARCRGALYRCGGDPSENVPIFRRTKRHWSRRPARLTSPISEVRLPPPAMWDLIAWVLRIRRAWADANRTSPFAKITEAYATATKSSRVATIRSDCFFVVEFTQQ